MALADHSGTAKVIPTMFVMVGLPAAGKTTRAKERAEAVVVLVPGMGDLRSAYRFLAPALRQDGYRVACTDLRGHGDSDTTFTSYGDVETAGDIIALIEELDGPAVVVGNSMGAGAAACAAAERPDHINGLVLVGPFVRNGKIARGHRSSLGSDVVELLSPQALQGAAAGRFRRIPQKRRCKSSPARIRQVLLPHHPHRPYGCRVASRRGRSTDVGRHGRARP